MSCGNVLLVLVGFLAGATLLNAAPTLTRTKRADEVIFDSSKSNDAKEIRVIKKSSAPEVVSVPGEKKSQEIKTGIRQERSADLMDAENMEADSEPEQKLRAKRDLDTDEIRQLFEMQPVNTDDIVYDSEEPVGYEEREEGAEPWLDYEPETETEMYRDEAERETVRELLAERAAEEARAALVAYLAGGQPEPEEEEPEFRASDYEISEEEPGDEMEQLANFRKELEGEEEEDEGDGLEGEKRAGYPYSYEPYGGRWGALVPGAKRGDVDPYDRLYRLAEALSRPSATGDDVEYEKK